jgi:hypothetical protein
MTCTCGAVINGRRILIDSRVRVAVLVRRDVRLDFRQPSSTEAPCG